MCVAYPGKVLDIEGRTARVDFAGTVLRVNVGVVDTRPGDYVLVHAGCAIESMSEEKAMEILEIFSDMEALSLD
jgi:hydrogenase expression/formation protein HypC